MGAGEGNNHVKSFVSSNLNSAGGTTAEAAGSALKYTAIKMQNPVAYTLIRRRSFAADFHFETRIAVKPGQAR